MNLIDICQLKYPGQIEAMNITFRKPEDELLFDVWKVPNVPRPTEAEIMAEAPQWERQYEISTAFTEYLSYIQNLLDTTAQSKQYGDAVACASYATSTNPQWAAEAAAFISWRDEVFIYAINIQTAVLQGGPIPPFEDFVSGLPQIVWP